MADVEFLKPTPWESRNLGVESFAISQNFYLAPNEQKLISEINRHIKKKGEIFIYARVEKRDYSVNSMLERIGFCFVEQTLEPHTRLAKNHVLGKFQTSRGDFLPGKYSQESLKVTRHDKSDRELSDCILKIAKESFSDDRFHLDQKCDENTAGQRFVYWAQDLLADPEVVFYLVRYKDDVAGFMARKVDHLVLAGFSKKYVGGGLGDYLWLCVLSDMKEQGVSRARTLVSANNIASLNLHARVGFKFRNPAVTFHYWGGAFE